MCAVVVGVEAMQRIAQRADQLVAEGVELLRAVQRQCDDLAVLLIVHERHRFPLCSRFADCHASRQNREETMAMIAQGDSRVPCHSCCCVSPAVAQKKYDPGASDSEIKLGQTMPYSGPAVGLHHAGQGRDRLFPDDQRPGRRERAQDHHDLARRRLSARPRRSSRRASWSSRTRCWHLGLARHGDQRLDPEIPQRQEGAAALPRDRRQPLERSRRTSPTR